MLTPMLTFMPFPKSNLNLTETIPHFNVNLSLDHMPVFILPVDFILPLRCVSPTTPWRGAQGMDKLNILHPCLWQTGHCLSSGTHLNSPYATGWEKLSLFMGRIMWSFMCCWWCVFLSLARKMLPSSNCRSRRLPNGLADTALHDYYLPPLSLVLI